MLYGLTGSHRSGKTSLARAVAEELDIEFYETSISKTAKEFGYDAVSDLTLTERLHLQTLLLDNHIKEISKRGRPLITDRTPLDFCGYLACEFTMNNGRLVTPETLNLAVTFMEKCLQATKDYYDFIFYLAPLSDYVVEDGKPTANPVYQMNHALTVMGAISQLKEEVNYALIFEQDWEVRKDFVHNALVKRMDAIDEERKTAIYLH